MTKKKLTLSVLLSLTALMTACESEDPQTVTLDVGHTDPEVALRVGRGMAMPTDDVVAAPMPDSELLVVKPPIQTATGQFLLEGETQWSSVAGGAEWDMGRATTADLSGNVISTGHFAGSMNFGCGSRSSTTNAMYILKTSSTGVCSWHIVIEGSDGIYPKGITINPSDGAIFVAGDFVGSADFGDGVRVSAGGGDGFLAKLTSSGALTWAIRFGGVGEDYIYGVAQSGGEAIVVGTFEGTAGYGGTSLVSAGSYDAFVARYSASGLHSWSQRFGGTGYDAANAVVTSGDDAIIITGPYSSAGIDFGGGNLANQGGYDGFVAALTGAGAHTWSQRFGSTGNDSGTALAENQTTHDIAVAGYFMASPTVGTDTLVAGSSYAAFVATYTQGGVYQWSRGFAPTGMALAESVTIDSAGAVLVGGQFSGAIDFGVGEMTATGGADMFIVKLLSNGEHAWSQRYGGSAGSVASASSIAAAGDRVVVTGYFTSSLDMGAGTMAGQGSFDIPLFAVTR